ncbi:MAG TPA: DUF1553 domain-containing protein, partial [Verrucomicrobiae bacterium]
DPANLGEEVPRHFLSVLGGQPLPVSEKGSGRLELADWLASSKNPLTARVMVNRIWQHHFGKGLVQTPSDFGVRGRPPTHPELLDYLAARFIESGWSVKAMHRAIMLSHAYQQAATENPRAQTLDPNNNLLWSFNRQRLDAEAIRDSMLQVSGELEPGPGMDHPFPNEALWDFTQHFQFLANYETRRRSVYVMQQRIRRHPFFGLFDGADPNATTAERVASITPLQALFAMNDPFVQEQAQTFGTRLLLSTKSDSTRIMIAFRMLYGRDPRREELTEALEYVRAFKAKLGKGSGPSQRDEAVWTSLARALLASNEFMFVE